jgi:hypothetical protein
VAFAAEFRLYRAPLLLRLNIVNGLMDQAKPDCIRSGEERPRTSFVGKVVLCFLFVERGSLSTHRGLQDFSTDPSPHIL